MELPKALMDVLRASEDKYRPFPPEILNDTSGRFSDCAVMRAGAIQVEKLNE